MHGKRQNPNSAYAGVVAKFKDNLLHNRPIVIYGDGSQTRDFIPVEEVVKANLLAGMLKKSSGDIFNIATGKSITLLELLSKLEKDIKQKRGEVFFEPARPGDLFSSQANCNKYKRLKTIKSSLL